MKLTPDIFGTTPDGAPVQRVTIVNGGLTAKVMTWGGSLQDLRLEGVKHALVLGSENFKAYLGPLNYAGAIVGRVANRIAGGRAELDGCSIELDRNEADRTTLHGGRTGAGEVNWTLAGYDERSCRMELCLGDGQDGFPGKLDLSATYRLEDDGAMVVEITGRTDAPTWCNIAQHSYWTLDGGTDHGAHRLTIPAETYLPVDEALIPQGAPCPVDGGRFDFRQARQVTRDGDCVLDHNFCFDARDGMQRLATLEAAGLRLDIDSTERGLQVYDAHFMESAPFNGHDGAPYGKWAGVALEPQGWPDAPNRADFPSVRLGPSDTYRQVSRFRVGRV